MKLNIYRFTKGSQKVDTEEVNFLTQGEFDMPLPHCDQSILHSPGHCTYCDRYPGAQALREHWRINFTNEHDPAKAPCPSTHFRSDQTRDLWPGNTPEGFLNV